MARPLDDQGRALLDAASKLLTTEGIGALTVRRMAAAAGCSTMGVYSRFGGKDGVLEELYKEGVRRLFSAVDEVGDTDDPLDDLRRCLLQYRRNALDNASHYLIVFGGAAPGFVPSPDAHTESLASFARLATRVERAQHAGLLIASEPPEQIAELIWGTIHGHVMLEIVGMSAAHVDPEQRYQRTIDVLLRGLAPQPDEPDEPVAGRAAEPDRGGRSSRRGAGGI
ncbi:MAG TPA: TetR/AcrR family transcriptional regulator [Acidimicrobiales bacterium]